MIINDSDLGKEKIHDLEGNFSDVQFALIGEPEVPYTRKPIFRVGVLTFGTFGLIALMNLQRIHARDDSSVYPTNAPAITQSAYTNNVYNSTNNPSNSYSSIPTNASTNGLVEKVER
jgi:hypothetical protein